MPYTAYVSKDYYLNLYSFIPDECIESSLTKASRHIDTLTYNRIVAKGFDNLTDFQKELIKEALCLQANFEYENADLIDTVISSYNINGVSMSFGANWNIYVDKGVAIKKDVYSLLEQTGLTTRRI